MHSLLLDLSVARRFFIRRRAAFAVIVLTMALALGANTAVFSVLKSFLFSHLAVPAPERVVVVPTTKDLPGRGRVDFSDAYPNFKLIRDTVRAFESIGTTWPSDVNWEQPERTRRLQGARATASFFSVMRIQPVLGRLYTAQEEGPRAASVVLIGHALWRSAFAGSRQAVGQTLRLNGVAHTIVGVLPERFAQPFGAEVWLPFDLADDMWTKIIGGRQLNTFARLAPGATVTAANTELRAFTPRAIEAEPMNKDWSWRAVPLRENLLNGADNALVFVQAGAAVLLLLAISNLASLLMAWAAERQRETAVRLALGASGWRLVRQFLVQSLTLVAVGGGAGVLLAWFSLPLLQQLNPNPVLAVFLQNLDLDRGTLLFSATLVVGTGLLAGLLPAWQSRALSFNEALRSESRGASLSRGSLRWQQAMVVAQAAISVLILVGAGFAALGFWKLLQVDLGFATEHRVALRMHFPEPAYAANERRAQLVRQLEANLRQEPALAGFGFTTTIPVGETQWGGGFYPQLSSGEFTPDPVVFHYRRVSPRYLSVMAIPLLEGRLLEDRDRAETTQVCVISKAAADKYWPGESALGKRLRRAATPQGPLVEVVGVAGNVRDAGAGFPVSETIYVPFDQAPLRRGSIVLHGRISTAESIVAGRRALRATDPGIAAYDIATLPDLAWQAQALPRLQVSLLGVFALIAIGITALGSYGVMSQLVANRQKEMAIRAALGATQGGVLRLILWQNARLAAAGTALGVLAAWLGGQMLQAKLTGFDASPLWPYAAVAGGVIVITQIASFIPARRAAKLDVHLVLAQG